jgi:pimeloyl-ACP methyl ester carboxylesterase
MLRADAAPGHSAGGSIACALVARHPEVVRHAVLYEPPLLAMQQNGHPRMGGIRAAAEQTMGDGAPRHGEVHAGRRG